MTVQSIDKRVVPENMSAADKQAQPTSALSAEAIFANVLQKTQLRFGGSADLPSANNALKARFDHPVAEERRPEPVRKADRPEPRRADKAERKEARSEARADKPTAADAPETREVADRADTDVPVEAKAAGADDRSTKDDTTQAASQQVEAPAAQPQQTPEQAVAVVEAQPVLPQTLLVVQAQAAPVETGAADAAGGQPVAQDPLAGLEQGDGQEIAKPSLDAATAATDSQQQSDAALAQANTDTATAAATAATAGAGRQKATGEAEKQAANTTDLAKSQADDLAQMLAGATARVEVKVSADTAAAPTPVQAAGAVFEALSMLEAAQGAAAEQQNPGSGQGGQGSQPGSQGLTTAVQVGANGALDNAQAAKGQAAEARPFAAALAAQLEATTASAANAADAAAPQVAGLGGPGATQSAQKPAAAQGAQAPHSPRPVPAQQVVEQISVQIDKAVKDGSDTVKIQLKPIELGKIEIKLEVGPEGKVTATITADKPETLALLQKDAKGLERALEDAGLKPETNAMSFNLRGEQQRNADRGNPEGRQGRRARALAAADGAQGLSGQPAAQARGFGHRSGVDISV